MSKTLMALLFPFLHTFNFGDGEGGAEAVQPQATEENVAPTSTETPSGEVENKEAVAPKTYTEEEVQALKDAEAAKIRNKYERKMERQRIEAETRAKVLQEVQQKPSEGDAKPKAEDYQDYGQYLEDLAEYKAREIVRSEKEAAQQEEARKSQMTAAQRQQERQSALLEAGESKYDDFEDVIKADMNQYSQAAFLSMLESDIGAELLYYLGTNPEEGKRIAALPAYAQAKEIGKLEDKLASKPKPKPSNAPDPIKPLGGGSSPTVDLKNASMDEYIELRKKQNPVWAR